LTRASIIIECGRQSGLGRVRRTLTLGRALRDQGVACDVYVTGDEGRDLIEALGFKALDIKSIHPTHDLLILDVCTYTGEEVTALCATARISCVIDDLAERPVTCDFVINPNLYAAELDYSAYKAQQIFRGPSCALVDIAFYEQARPAAERNGFVVSFGGTDDGSLAASVVLELTRRTNEPIYIPLPAYQEPCAALLALEGDKVTILRSPDMADLLGRARTYVGAAGATVLEALAAGCHVCAAATQADQHLNVRFLPTVGIAALERFDAAQVSVLAIEHSAREQARPLLTPTAVAAIAKQVRDSLI
jgi:spore coat polysaccharide biosynthesis predicted glycosyltransferase SpsG